MKDLWDAVRTQTNGRVDVTVFPNNQLGGDTAMLQQLRAGALQIMTLDGGILESVVPVAAIQSVGFAFSDPSAAYRTFDGKLGAYVRGEIESKGIHPFEKIWENGMRMMTSSAKPIHTAADLAGFKMRTPSSRIALDLFRSLGSAPTPMNFSELYTSLQTHVVDGQENPLANIEFARFFEVQKYLTLSGHMWGGYWLLASGDWWKSLPADVQAIVSRNAVTYGERQRRDVDKLNDTLIAKLRTQGMEVIDKPDRASMKAKLPEFYKRWKAEFGDTAWSLLEGSVGKLG
jgi:tripartite ATP-independent transporter DctP family solute receptor